MSEWSILGYPGDPIPGDPPTVYSAARSFTVSAQSLSQAATGLRRMAAGDNVGETPTALIAKAGDLATKVQAAYEVCQRTGTALADYANSLDHAQRQAREALAAASAQRADYDASVRNSQNFEHQLKSCTTPEVHEQLLSAWHQANARAESAQGNLHALKARVQEAIANRDAAGQLAASRVDHIFDNTGMKDSTWDEVKEAWDDFTKFVDDVYHLPGIKGLVDAIGTALKWVWDHLDEISFALTVLALATCWIPGVNVVTGALAGLAKAVKILAVVVKVVSYLSIAKSMVAFGAAAVRHDQHGMVAAATGLALTLGLGKIRVLKRPAESISKSAFQGMARLSRSETGSYSAANRALVSLPARTTRAERIVDHFTGASASSRRLDALASTLKGTPSARQAGDLLVAKVVANKAVGAAMGVGKSAIKDGVSQIDQALFSPASGTRVTHTSCPVPASAGTGGVEG